MLKESIRLFLFALHSLSAYWSYHPLLQCCLDYNDRNYRLLRYVEIMALLKSNSRRGLVSSVSAY